MKPLVSFCALLLASSSLFSQKVGLARTLSTPAPKSTSALPQMGIVQNANANVLAGALLNPTCATISNPSISGNAVQFGIFSGGSPVIGLDSGIVLSTGGVSYINQPNTSTATGTSVGSSQNDADLQQLVGGNQVFDATKLEFDIVPATFTIKFELVFASEEYCEFSGNSQFNDAFGVFINGPGISGTYSNGAANLALVPGTNDPITTNAINPSANSTYFLSNADPSNTLCPLPNNPLAVNEVIFDGFTTKLTVTAFVQPGQSYHVKLKLCDSGDAAYDSAIFIKATAGIPVSFVTPVPVGPLEPVEGTTVVFSIPVVNGATSYLWTPPANCSINGQPVGQAVATSASSGGNSIQLTIGCGGGNLCVTPIGDCLSASTGCRWINCAGSGEFVCAVPSAQLPVDDCESISCFCGNQLNGYMGSTAGFTPGSVSSYCGSIENEQWFGLVANGTSATFTATPIAGTCLDGNGLQIALYENCGGPFLQCNVGCSGCGLIPQSITVTNLVVGHSYSLLVDGWAGDVCQFKVSIDPPGILAPTVVNIPGPIMGSGNACPGGSTQYCISPVTGADAYFWEIPVDASINGEPGPGPIKIAAPCADITWGNSIGPKTIQIRPANACVNGAKSTKMVKIQAIGPTILLPEVVCFEDAPNFELPWGDGINPSPGTQFYQTTLLTAEGCDSLVKKTVTVKSQLITNLPPKVICAGDCVSVGGEQFCESGFQSVVIPSYQGCDSTVNFLLTVLDPVAEIIGSGIIGCGNQAITLNSAPVPLGFPLKSWTNSSGQVVGTGPSISVGQPDTYILKVVLTQNGVTCTKFDTIVVTSNSSTPPDVESTGGIIGCGSPTVVLSASSSVPGTVFQWAGPGSFSATGAFVPVSSVGTYTVTATDPAGCTAVAVSEVTLEDKVGTFSVAQNPASIGSVPAVVTTVAISDVVKNESTTPIEIGWERTFIDLTTGCQSSVEDKTAWHPASTSSGQFQLGAGETTLLKIHLADADTSICCGMVHLLLRNTCTLADSLELVFLAGCPLGATEMDLSQSIHISPNPGNGLFEVENPIGQTFLLKIFDQLGQVVFSQKMEGNKPRFSLLDEPDGGYFAVFETIDGRPFGAVRLVVLH